MQAGGRFWRRNRRGCAPTRNIDLWGFDDIDQKFVQLVNNVPFPKSQARREENESFPRRQMRIFLGHREKFIGLRDNRSLKPSGLKKIVMKVVSDPVARRSGASLIKRESPYGSRQQFIWTRRVFCLTPAPPAPDTGSVSKEAL